ncbi:unnamed protein product [Closterium sp. NIES-65]|nr:unnamed protein product [Closterium sp. NIES-65]
MGKRNLVNRSLPAAAMPSIRCQAPPTAVVPSPTVARAPSVARTPPVARAPTIARPATVKPSPTARPATVKPVPTARPATVSPVPTVSSSPTIAPSSAASPPTSDTMLAISTPTIAPFASPSVVANLPFHFIAEKSSSSARRRNAPTSFAPPPAALRSGAAMADCLMSYSRMLHLMPGRSRDLVAAGAGVLDHVLESLRNLLDTDQVKGVEAERLLFEVERDLGRLQFELAVTPEAFPVQAVRLQCAHAARVLRSV